MMKLNARYQRLSLADKFGIWGSIATMLALLAAIAPMLSRSPPFASAAAPAMSPPTTPGNSLSGVVAGTNNTIIQGTSGTIILTPPPREPPRPGYPDPSATEMRQAVLQDVQRRGIGSSVQALAVKEILKLGVTLDIVDFDKVACIAAIPDPGYTCDFQYAVRGALESSDSDPNTRKSLDDLNHLIEILTRDKPLETGRGRFVKTQQHWVLLTP